jgi:DNA-binding NarL/FixJ family response regulator
VDRFTQRELDVITAFMADGAPNRIIGRRLYLSEKTVKCHMGSMMRKVGAQNRTQLAIMLARAESEGDAA